MDLLTKKDLRISLLVGVLAGILILPTLNNVGVVLNLRTIILVVLGLTIFTPVGYLIAYWLSRWLPVLIQFVKFGIVGGLNAAIDLGVLNLFIYGTGIATGAHFSLFKSISFIVAVSNSYFWNKYWTFRADGEPKAKEFLGFFLVNIVGFGINVGVATVVVNFVSIPAGVSVELWANISAVSAAIITLFWNFAGMKFLVFKK